MGSVNQHGLRGGCRGLTWAAVGEAQRYTPTSTIENLSGTTMSGWGAVLPDKDMVLGGTAPSERMREDSLITGGRWSCLMSKR